MSRRGGAKTTRVCLNCSGVFMAYLIELRRGRAKFCSVICYRLYQRRNKLTTGECYKRQREHNHEIKRKVFCYYGGDPPKCSRCGIIDIDVLCLDHINGGGTQDRLDTRHWGTKLYYHLIKNHFPGGYQVLCANCNLKKYIVEHK